MVGGEATAGNINRNRSPSKMTKYVECWGADKPFANITESTLAKNIGLTVSKGKIGILQYPLEYLIVCNRVYLVLST